jgi:excisionase family DNA binding protein
MPTNAEPLPLDTGAGPGHARVVVDSPTVTPAQMAESVGVSRATIERRTLNGDIASDRRGGRHRIRLVEVERFRHAHVREMARDLAADF